MTISTQQNTVITTSYSGDYRIDVLLPSATARWNFGSPVGTAVTLTYSFMTATPTYATESDKKGFSVFTDAQKSATSQILNLIAKQVGIKFVEVSDTATDYGTLRFGNNDQGLTSAGYAYLPDTADPTTAGDMYINNRSADNLSNIVPGQDSYATLVHELGHTLGLKHPGNYNAGEPSSAEPGNYLTRLEDYEGNTIMSYVKAPQKQDAVFFGKYDLLALTYLYGAVPYNTGDTVIAFDDASGRKLITLNDSGGIDTIDLSKVSVGATIDLTSGANSSVGLLADGSTAAVNNISIAYGVTIENVIGTAGADTLVGNAANNTLRGGGGDDTIDGGAGIDTSLYAGMRSNFTVAKTTSGFTVTDKTLTEGKDTVINVERLQFATTTINLTVGDVVKSAPAAAVKSIVELYIAYFNRVPDADGMAYWISQNVAGQSVDAIGKTFYEAAVSPNFSALTGYSATMTDADFVKVIYKNVLGRSEVDAGGLNYWTTALAKAPGQPGGETKGTLVKTILGAAHGFKGDAQYGFVADLLDNKFAVGKYFALEQGLNFNTPEASFSNGVAIAGAVTSTDTSAAITLIGVNDPGFKLV